MHHRRPTDASALSYSFLLLVAMTLAAPACAPAAPAPSTASRRPATATTTPATTASTASDSAIKPPASQLTWKTERVVVFKDGYGLVIKSGSGVADAEGFASSDDVPEAAVLGCFWAVGADDNIVGMRAEWVDAVEQRDRETACLSMAELLRANVAKSVTLELNDNTRLDGRIEQVLDVPEEAAPLSMEGDSGVAAGDVVGATVYPRFVPPPGSELRSAMTGSFTRDTIPNNAGTLIREINPRGGNHVVIVQNQRKIVLPVQAVESVSGGDDVVTTVTRQQEVFSRGKRLSFSFGTKSAGQNVSLRLFYFTPGLRWIPTYRVGGELADKAGLSLQGEILNEIGDIEHAALDLVVGVPNFRFANTLSPLTLEQMIRSAALAAQVNISNSMLQSQFRGDNRFRGGQGAGGGGGGGGGSGTATGAEGDAGMAMAPELAGSAGEQDLFVYSIADFSLKKGARATVPLWRQSAPLRHVYTFDIRARRNRAGGGLIDGQFANVAAGPPEQQQDPRSPNRIVLNQVWHQLELTNSGTVPWTTGAALLLRGNLPLGQDLLVYTPPAGKARLPVTVAVDIRGAADERETGRTPNALRFDGNDWSEVRKTGTVTVTSYRKEKSAMSVTLSTGGKVTTASDNGTIKLNDFRATDWGDDPAYMRVNNHSDVTWEFDLEPGKTKTITYEVSFYAR